LLKAPSSDGIVPVSWSSYRLRLVHDDGANMHAWYPGDC